MTREDRLKILLETKEFEFLKDIPQENIWKLIFTISFVEQEPKMSEEIDFIQPKKVVGKMISMSVIDDIKAELTYIRDSWEKDNYHDEADALTLALKKIDKHIGGAK